jgi:protein phosphatase
MQPVQTNAMPLVGDVLHHPAFGFATVQESDRTGVTLRWERQGSGHPIHVTHAALSTAYRRCQVDGLFARSVRDPDEVRALVETEPLTALAMLLHEVEGPLDRADVRDWLLARRLSSPSRFDAWWDALQPLFAQDERFVFAQGAIALREGISREDALRARTSALPPPGSLPAAAAFAFGIRLARALADVHVAGLGLVPDRTLVECVGDAIRFRTRGAPTSSGRRDDVRFAVRLLLEQVLGPLPSAGELAESDLTPLLGGLGVQLPLELVAVVLEALAADGGSRPADGFALWERLRGAEAIWAVRQAAPWARQASACAGFNTHIGVLKSLQSQVNQDAFLLVGEPTWSLLCVADGISQCNAGSGDLASGLCIRTLRVWWAEQADALRDADVARIQSAVVGALDRANQIVCDTALRLGSAAADPFIPMGTTALVALTRGNRVHLASLGDSRAYLVGRHGVALLTGDQNVHGDRLRESLAGRRVEWRDGGTPLVGYIGHFGPDGAPELAPVAWRTVLLLPGEWLIVCSDGLTDYAGPEEASIGQLLSTTVRQAGGATLAAQAMEVCRTLVDAANRGGGGDNVTVLALTLSSEYGATAAAGPVTS